MGLIKESVATGRRKMAVASVRIRPGNGRVVINGKFGTEYFKTKERRDIVLAPLVLIGLVDSYDILIRVRGGGLEGQSGAARLGLSRAITAENESYKQILRESGFLTRDHRRRERKKYGQPGARKRYQFSKR